jgi:hypothetical protein
LARKDLIFEVLQLAYTNIAGCEHDEKPTNI